MWLCFNSNGALVEPALQHGPAARAGTTNFQIFAYFQGIDLTVNSLATIKLFKPDLTHSSYPLLAMRRVDLKYEKKAGENSSYFAEDGGPHGDGIYPGFLFDFSNFSGDQNVAILLDTPGLWEAVISLYGIDHIISVQGTSTFNVQYGNVNNDGTEISFDELMASFSSAIAGKLDIEDGIVSVDNISLVDTDNYSEGQMFYDKNTSSFYELTDGHMVPVSVGGGGSNVTVVELSGTQGELSGTQATALIQDNTIILDENGYVYRKSRVQNNGTIIYQRMSIGESAVYDEFYYIYTASDTYSKVSNLAYAPKFKVGTLSSTLQELGRYITVGSQSMLVVGTTILKIDNATCYSLTILTTDRENIAHVTIEKLGTYERYDYDVPTTYQQTSFYLQPTTPFSSLLQYRRDYAVCGEYSFSDDGTKTINDLINFLNGVSDNKIIRIVHSVNSAWIVYVSGYISYLYNNNCVCHLTDIHSGKFIHFDSSSYLSGLASVNSIFNPSSSYWKEYDEKEYTYTHEATSSFPEDPSSSTYDITLTRTEYDNLFGSSSSPDSLIVITSLAGARSWVFRKSGKSTIGNNNPYIYSCVKENRTWKIQSSSTNGTYSMKVSCEGEMALNMTFYNGISSSTTLSRLYTETNGKPFFFRIDGPNSTNRYYLALLGYSSVYRTYEYEIEAIGSQATNGEESKARYAGSISDNDSTATLGDILTSAHRLDFLINDSAATGYTRRITNTDPGHSSSLSNMYSSIKSSSALPAIYVYSDIGSSSPSVGKKILLVKKLSERRAGSNTIIFEFQDIENGEVWSSEGSYIAGSTTLYSILSTNDYLTRESFDCKLNDYLTRYYINIFVDTQSDHSFVPLRFNGLISGNKQQIFTYFKNATEQAATTTGITIPEITDTATLNNAINLIVNAMLAAGTTDAREGALMLLAALGAYDTCGSIQTHNFTTGVDTTSNFVRTVYGGGGYALPYVINDEDNQVHLLSVRVLIDDQLTALHATAVEVQVVIPGVE